MPVLTGQEAAAAATADLATDSPYVGLGPAVGRKVLRYWPKDAHRNKGDPWFEVRGGLVKVVGCRLLWRWSTWGGCSQEWMCFERAQAAAATKVPGQVITCI